MILPTSPERPFGALASFGIVLAALVGGLGAAILAARLAGLPPLAAHGHPAVSAQLLLLFLGALAVIGLALRLKRAGAADYLAFCSPRGRAGLIVLVGISTIVLPLLVQLSSIRFDLTRVTFSSFTTADAHGGLVLLLVEIVLVAPLAEEVVFRGFLHRGLAASRLGIVGAVLVTSALWALLHAVSHGAQATAMLVLVGIAWGWMRWYSGSLLPGLAFHIANNGLVAAFSVTRIPSG